MPRRQEKTAKRFQEFDALASMGSRGVLLLHRSLELQFASSAACLLLGETKLATPKRAWREVRRKLEFSRISGLKEGNDPLSYRINFTTGTGVRPLRLEIIRLSTKGATTIWRF